MKKNLFLSAIAVSLLLCSCTESHTHTYSDIWNHDDTYHYHKATCGHDVKKDEEKHSFVNKVVAPSYDSDGYTKHTCSVCEYTYVDSVTPKLNHNYSSSWSYDATKHYHLCTDSGYESLKSDEENHTYVDTIVAPTYDTKGYTLHECSVCEYSYKTDYVDELTRTYNLVIDFNGGTSLTHEGSTQFSKVIESFSKDDFFFDLSKDGYVFRGYEYKGEIVVNEKGEWKISTPTLEDTMTFTASFLR